MLDLLSLSEIHTGVDVGGAPQIEKTFQLSAERRLKFPDGTQRERIDTLTQQMRDVSGCCVGVLYVRMFSVRVWRRG